MFHRVVSFVFAAVLLLPSPASAAPIKLKLSFFSSDRSIIYQCHIRPFVSAVNDEGTDVVEIGVYFSGAISAEQEEQDRLVASGAADLALVVPARSAPRFADTAVMELPGLFADEFVGSRVFTRLIDAGSLQGYGDFVVLGSTVSAGESIHSRKPIRTLADLKGQTIRVNNEIEAGTLREFGATPAVVPLNRTMDALAGGKIDGATVPPSLLFEFSFGRLTNNHYLLHMGGVPTVLVMNRAKYASLPPRAQEILHKHAGEAAALQTASCMAEKDQKVREELKADSRRRVVVPSPADLAVSRRVFENIREQWAAGSPHNRALLDRVRAETATLRATER